MVRTVASVELLLALTACRGGEGSGPPADPAASATRLDKGLRDELVQMQAQDQGERTSGETLDDTERTERLKEIIDEHGWPTYALVGKQGEDAAWVIAQHSDLDPEFQAEALELLRQAVADGQASPGNLAYLEDRVRAGRGEPQLYGTQMGCTRGGRPARPDIEEPAALDARRQQAGLPPYDRYVRQMTRICAQ